MHRLKGRLRKLEARIDAGRSWNDYFADAEKLAPTMLSADDRNFMAEVSARWKERGYRVRADLPPSVLERWNSAFDRAVAELQIPWSITAADAWL